jgi:metacaspase-1
MDKYALCIGINDYPGTGSDLAGCVNDARDWGAMLGKKGFSVAKLLDKKATGNGIRAAIKATLAQAVSGDLVVIQYSGHGSFVPDVDGEEPDGTDECICPYDINSKGEITDDELFNLYSAKQAGVKLLVVSDSCHSGSVSKFMAIATPPSGKGRSTQRRRVRFLPPQAFLKGRRLARLGIRRASRSSGPPGRHAGLLMAGCQDHEYSYDAYFQGRPNGAFSFVALRALAKLGKTATYQNWFDAIRKVLPSQQYPQSPNLFGAKSMKRWKVLA